ncbi:MAG: type II secretion system protein GspD, partial [Planctomycetota bacterium]
ISEFTGDASVISTGGTAVGLLPPAKTRKEMKNVITLPNGKTVILGGLTSRYQHKTVSKVPLLGDIPLIGELFRSTQTRWNRKNFYVFITPHIITGDRTRELETMSRVQLKEAEGLGADLTEADRHYRSAFREEREMASLPKGRTTSLMTYRPPRER